MPQRKHTATRNWLRPTPRRMTRLLKLRSLRLRLRQMPQRKHTATRNWLRPTPRRMTRLLKLRSCLLRLRNRLPSLQSSKRRLPPLRVSSLPSSASRLRWTRSVLRRRPNGRSTAQNTYEQQSKENEIEKVTKEQDVKYKTKEATGL